MNCQIRPWKLEDASALAKVLNNRLIRENLRDGLPYPYTKKDAEAYIRFVLAEEPDRMFSFAVCVDECVIGCISVSRQENIHSRTAEVGYYLSRKYWGKGYMTEALQQLCEMIFAGSDLIRLYAEPLSRNIASCRVLEKAGFQLEGTLRCNAVKNGEILDSKLYARIKE